MPAFAGMTALLLIQSFPNLLNIILIWTLRQVLVTSARWAQASAGTWRTLPVEYRVTPLFGDAPHFFRRIYHTGGIGPLQQREIAVMIGVDDDVPFTA